MVEQISFPANLKDMDQNEFGRLVEAYRRELRAHCYRMLGSLQEAEDMVQETLWRAWDRRETYAGRASLRAWLYKIATNLCIDALRQRPRRGLPITLSEAASPDDPISRSINEPIWLEPYPFDLPGPEEENPEARISRNESIKLAFLTSLHLLPPRQRAVLLLRDVLDWPTDEVAKALEESQASVKSALHRARFTLARRQQLAAQENVAEQVDEETMRVQLEAYIKAWESADVAGFVALLKEDCTFSMPPTPSWYAGRENVAALVSRTIFGGQAAGRWRLLPTWTNGQPGFGLYRLNEEDGIYSGYGIQVVTWDADRIADITTFRNPALLEAFDLPSTIER
jgi:RNA polymerase sigma-70 factor (ECF subfamily)